VPSLAEFFSKWSTNILMIIFRKECEENSSFEAKRSIRGQKREKKRKDIKEVKNGGFNLLLHPSSLVCKQVAF